MSNRSSVPVGCGYRVTQDGHDAMMSPEVCPCRPEVRGGLYLCRDCGTLFSRLTGTGAYRALFLKRGERE
jgi:hypothetical protein